LQRCGKRGKSELWYVLEAAEGARLLSGLSKEFSKERYDQIAGGPEIMDYLCQHIVSEGDVFFLPAGRIHSIGKGCFVLEIQQSSDITYRIYDYGRPGLDGRPRELHTAEARDAIDYRLYPDYKLDYQRTENQENVLVSCPHFTSSFFKLTRTVTKSVCELGSCVIAVCAEGEGSVNGLAVRAGESLLIPACAERLVMSPGSRGMTILTANC
ncbi:MAG: class I mannose-6-phosphate isomerase, partial [Bacteroidales bacterium]|nr:class I mannose-6-phosphate isomerase [Bacteroidales bacterium]